jgi:hypothetical protein
MELLHNATNPTWFVIKLMDQLVPKDDNHINDKRWFLFTSSKTSSRFFPDNNSGPDVYNLLTC